jgi:LuxR family maltose regulon positive regulatory protein
LETLEAANLFVTPLDGDRHWYRYYGLFADFLRVRLRQAYAEQIPASLHRRAALWYEQNGLAGEAIKHLLAAEAFNPTADLIEQTARGLLARGEHTTIISWLAALPEDLVRSRPRLCLAHLRALAYARDIQGIQARLHDVEAALSSPQAASYTSAEVNHFRAEAAAYQALLAFWRDEDATTAIALCRQALKNLAQDDLALRGIITLILGIMLRIDNDLEAASRTLAEASTINQQANNLILMMNAQMGLVGIYEVQGRLRQAEAICQQALQLATRPDGRYLPAASFALVGLGKIYREWNDLDGAADYLGQALELARPAGLDDVILDATITLALVQAGQGRWPAALANLEGARQIVGRWGRARPLGRVALFEARLGLMRGQLDTAVGWAEKSRLGINDPLSDWDEPSHLTLARTLLAQTNYDEALILLNRLLEMAVAGGRTGRKIEILALQGLVFDGQGKQQAAIEASTQALSLAEPEGYVRLFVDEGEPMVKLLARLPSTPYRDKLLSAFDRTEEASVEVGEDTSPSAPSPPGSPALIEPLSEREIEVLQLIAAGYSNREIAHELVIALGTVKKHINNIFGKLYVHSRTQAVARATELGLI